MRAVLASDRRASPILLSGVMLKSELLDACIELASPRSRVRQRHSTDSLSHLHSTGHVGSITPPIWKAMNEDARTCESSIVISAYYNIDMLRKLAKGEEVKILLNGLAERRLHAQVAELEELQHELGRRTEIKLSFAPGIFHPKMYLFGTKGDRYIAWIGSANATSAALSSDARNEEVMLRLDPAPDFLVEYAMSAWEQAQPIEECESPVNSLQAFFQTGALYYEPYANLVLSVNPFLQLLHSLRPEEKGSLEVFEHRSADDPVSIGAFNIGRVYKREEYGDDVQIKRIPVTIRPYAIETCYGSWVPSHFCQKVEDKLNKASREDEEYYWGLREWLKVKGRGRKLVVQEFKDYLLAARDTMEEHGVDWKPALARTHIPNPFENLRPIEDLIERVVDYLSDTRRREKLSRAFVRAAVPNFGDDLEAAGEFEQTFFQSLEEKFLLRRRPSVVKSFFDAGIPKGSYAEIRRGLEACLLEEEWYRDRFLL